MAGAIARAVEILAGADTADSFVRTFAYHTGAAYGLLLDASSPGWRQRIRGTDDFPALLAAAFSVQPAADAAVSASRYGGAEIRAAEEQRDRGRQERLAELRRQFVDGPVLVIRGGRGGAFNSMGAVVIPDIGTVFFVVHSHQSRARNTDSQAPIPPISRAPLRQRCGGLSGISAARRNRTLPGCPESRGSSAPE